MTLSLIFTRSLATLSLFGALAVPATLIAAPSTTAPSPAAPSSTHVDTQSDFIMSDGRICVPRWGCNTP
jgi:hypothetical protein